MKKLTLVVCLVCVSLFAAAGDTQTVTSHSGNCALSVPSSWTVEPLVGGAHSPDKKVSVVVSSPTHGLNSLAEVEEMAPTIYKEDKVTKRSSSEFEMEGKSMNGKPNVYRAIPAGAHVCIAEITYESGTDADAKAILATMKSK